MQQAKIGIVEDEVIIADSIQAVLKGMNYAVPEPCSDYEEAINMLHTEQPDLVLLDINLGGSPQDGIEIARYIREHIHIPLIFLTANSDPSTLSRAKTVTPNAFLVKPFQRDDLYTAIEIAMHNFYHAATGETTQPRKDHVFIKEPPHFYKVAFDDILYLESDHVYVHIYTTGRKYLVRSSLQQYLDELDNEIFVRIHRGYVVNKTKIDAIGPNSVVVGSTTIPVSKTYRDKLQDIL